MVLEQYPSLQQVRAAFNRAAHTYDSAAILQREVATRLLERLDLLTLPPQQILDVGAGTGFCSAALTQRYPTATLVALDLAEAMLQQCRRRLGGWQRWRRGHSVVAADAARLPFANASFDLIFSSLTLQWCGDLDRLFAEFRRVLRPGGVLLFTTFGPDTLWELRASWAAVDAAVHVNHFLDMHEVGDAMVRAQLNDPVMDSERITLTYREPVQLLRELKAIGAHNINPGRHVGLTGRQRLMALYRAYEQYRAADGRLPASYEVLYGHAYVTTQAVANQAANRRAESTLSLDRLQQLLRERSS